MVRARGFYQSKSITQGNHNQYGIHKQSLVTMWCDLPNKQSCILFFFSYKYFIPTCLYIQLLSFFLLHLFLKNHMVGNSTNALNFNFNQIAIIEITRLFHAHSHTSRRTRHDNGTLLQSGTLRDK